MPASGTDPSALLPCLRARTRPTRRDAGTKWGRSSFRPTPRTGSKRGRCREQTGTELLSSQPAALSLPLCGPAASRRKGSWPRSSIPIVRGTKVGSVPLLSHSDRWNEMGTELVSSHAWCALPASRAGQGTAEGRASRAAVSDRSWDESRLRPASVPVPRLSHPGRKSAPSPYVPSPLLSHPFVLDETAAAKTAWLIRSSGATRMEPQPLRPCTD